MGGYYYFDKTTHLRTNNAFRDEWGNTYYFGGDGRAVTGLQTINGNKYYFGDDGTYTLRKSQWPTITTEVVRIAPLITERIVGSQMGGLIKVVITTHVLLDFAQLLSIFK